LRVRCGPLLQISTFQTTCDKQLRCTFGVCRFRSID
jgi:hypothetical protein